MIWRSSLPTVNRFVHSAKMVTSQNYGECGSKQVEGNVDFGADKQTCRNEYFL